MGQVFRTGDRVYWEDPDDGICSGRYTVTGVNGEVVALRRGAHYAEAPAHELTKLKPLPRRKAKSAVKVVDETYHWIAGNGRDHWIAKYRNSGTYVLFVTTVLGAYKCASPEEAQRLVDCEETQHLLRQLDSPGKFRVYRRSDKVEIEPVSVRRAR